MNRYTYIGKTRNSSGKEVYTTTKYPDILVREDDIYITTNNTDRLDMLAYRYYGNPRYWWIIAMVNNLSNGSLAVEGNIQLRLPANPESVVRALQEANRQ